MHDKRVQAPRADISVICKLDQLTVMQFIEKAWSYLTKETIANCWRHTKILEQLVLDEYELSQQMIKANAEANSTTQRLFSVMHPDQKSEDIQFHEDDNVEMGFEEDRTVEQVFERVEERNEDNEENKTILRKRKRDAVKLGLDLIFANLEPLNVEQLDLLGLVHGTLLTMEQEEMAEERQKSILNYFLRTEKKTPPFKWDIVSKERYPSSKIELGEYGVIESALYVKWE
ncbi:unnamed protein product [Rhizopus stolonifer]